MKGEDNVRRETTAANEEEVEEIILFSHKKAPGFAGSWRLVDNQN
jgi:hypothetical protein